MPRIILLITVFLCLAAPVAGAQDLYAGTVPVAGQGVQEREQAVPDALIQVLQKQSGLRELPIHPALDQALKEAQRLMLSFQYLESERQLPDGGTEIQQLLSVQFLPDAVDNLVREMGLPRWRLERDPVVIWMVVDDGRSRELMPLEYQYAFDRVEDIAALRGLPVAWPGLSEELKEQIDLQLLWGGYTEQLLAAGSASSGVVIVAARREGPEWNLRWTYADLNATTSWRSRDRELSFALADGVHQLTDLVASVNSIGPAGLGIWQVELLVAGMHSGQDYARCLNYLQGLSLVDDVSVLQAGPAGVRLVLALNADPDYLQRAIVRDGVLESGEQDNEFRLVP